jgi:K+-sensing histidine kinase KdpD
MRSFTVLFTLLLCYIIAAYSFWWITLNKQSSTISGKEVLALRQTIDSNRTPVLYAQRLGQIEKRQALRTSQYMGEGMTFLAIILVGASVVYSSFRRSVRLSRQQNNFMLSVTHELKSPIAAMKLTLQTLRKHKLEENKQRELLDRCIQESDRLNELCSNILIASQMEGGQYKSSNEVSNWSELATETLQSYQQRYPERFTGHIEPGIAVAAETLLLQLALNNILENAVKYTPADKPVELTLRHKDGRAILQVADNGVGIPDEEKRKVFEKFYRVGNEETRRSKGTGLGLYLTWMIVHQCRGTIAVKDNKPQGSIFEISLPGKKF